MTAETRRSLDGVQLSIPQHKKKGATPKVLKGIKDYFKPSAKD
jgi:hypothetical protein